MAEQSGIGYHSADVPMEQLVLWYRYLFIFELVYFTAVTFPKLAALSLYLRLFNWKGFMRVATIILIFLTIVAWGIMAVCSWLLCRPFDRWWNGSLDIRCHNTQEFFHGQSIPGFVIDLFILFLPMKTIWDLKLPMIKRAGLVIIFLIGGL